MVPKHLRSTAVAFTYSPVLFIYLHGAIAGILSEVVNGRGAGHGIDHQGNDAGEIN